MTDCGKDGCTALQLWAQQTAGMKDLLSALNTSVTKLDRTIGDHAKDLSFGTQEFNDIKDTLGKHEGRLHEIDIQLSLISGGSCRVSRRDAGYAVTGGGVVMVLDWLVKYFLGG